MRERIAQFHQERQELVKDLRAYCKDTTIPLETRWESFLDSGDILPVHSWQLSPIMEIYSDCLYDDFYMDRHTTSTFSEIDEQVCQNSTLEGEEPGYRAEFWDACYAKRDEWREAVLASGYSGFINDW